MKKALFFILLTGAAIAAGAQSVSLSYNRVDYANGDTIHFTTDEVEPMFIPTLNNSDTEHDSMQASCTAIDADGMQVLSLCAGVCLAGNVSPVFSMPAGREYTQLFVDFEITTSDTGLFLLKIYSTQVPNDTLSVYIELVFTGTHAGIAQQDNRPLSLLPYPNPAVGQLHISYTLPEGCENGRIVMRNLMGATVREVAIQQASGTVTLDLSQLSHGVYMCGILTNNRLIGVKKVVVM
ncbi:MAG: T9SS type A sorting domain-containing protein [Bacteroidales bacterium]|nr:T9SS type A sorting domain-containing protein [Bacteroidales bacterium]